VFNLLPPRQLISKLTTNAQQAYYLIVVMQAQGGQAVRHNSGRQRGLDTNNQ
jgi:hypothetical protein